MQAHKLKPKLARSLNSPFTGMSKQICTYTELRKEIGEALRRQHPEWIQANGKSPWCDLYESRFADMLALLTPREDVSQLKNSP
jgi:hypothetical protein